MTIITWLAGPNGQIFCSASAITILVLMLFMSIRLYASYRNKKNYRLLILSIPVFMIQRILVTAAPYSGHDAHPWLQLSASLLQTAAFININYVLLRLYAQRSARLKATPFIVMTAAAFLIAAAQLFFALRAAAR
ncbi:hypothetical protein [Paenibacillus protaetiae]|uniref:hypothetical protein n=1 Tax=Paenibacillus protaetiae TaxID=2509456 RepID=UPI001FC8EC26|nr:hypothetical protein [Paenibacillus protaetiae]